jgi:hypothetical protein
MSTSSSSPMTVAAQSSLMRRPRRGGSSLTSLSLLDTAVLARSHGPVARALRRGDNRHRGPWRSSWARGSWELPALRSLLSRGMAKIGRLPSDSTADGRSLMPAASARRSDQWERQQNAAAERRPKSTWRRRVRTAKALMYVSKHRHVLVVNECDTKTYYVSRRHESSGAGLGGRRPLSWRNWLP